MDKDFLIRLLETISPSGYEVEGRTIFDNFCESNNLTHEFTDKIGNSAFSIGEGNIPFMLSGHIDEIALQVQYIDDNGFVHFIKDGGIDPKTLPGRNVVIKGSKIVFGVIGKTPIHVEWHTDDKEKVTKVKDLKIDIGASNREEAEKMGVRVGDPIVFDKKLRFLGDNRIAACGIDDKVGVFIAASVLVKLQHEAKPLKALKVYGVACVQEEVGGNGAYIASKKINPQYSIDYDVTFATDDDCVSKNEWGDIKLGGGGCIAFGPDKNLVMCRSMVDVCNRHNIPYQPFAVGTGMTNTLGIKTAADDCFTLLMSIPERNMHTPVEVFDLRDIESLIDMTYHYIVELDKNLSSVNNN